jgi:hypothetical protein
MLSCDTKPTSVVPIQRAPAQHLALGPHSSVLVTSFLNGVRPWTPSPMSPLRGAAAVRRRPGLGRQRQGRRPQNLQRWTSTRCIKETFAAATDHRHLHQG